MPGGSNPTASKKRSRKAPVETTPPRATRSRHAAAVAETKALAQRVLSSPDIVHLILPQLGLREFVSLRGTCSEIKGATQTVCEDLIQILERASHLYISPQFADGLRLIADFNPSYFWTGSPHFQQARGSPPPPPPPPAAAASPSRWTGPSHR